MTFSKVNDIWSLTRFANKLNTLVNGSFSKLLKYFISEYNPSEIITFADLQYSYGDLYINHKFENVYESDPSYFYIFKDKRYHRSSFMKDKIKERFGLTQEEIESKTETELILQLGVLRIWDSGKIKFNLKLNN
jgi:hypothetical protein